MHANIIMSSQNWLFWRCIKNPVEYLRRSFFAKIVNNRLFVCFCFWKYLKPLSQAYGRTISLRNLILRKIYSTFFWNNMTRTNQSFLMYIGRNVSYCLYYLMDNFPIFLRLGIFRTFSLIFRSCEIQNSSNFNRPFRW